MKLSFEDISFLIKDRKFKEAIDCLDKLILNDPENSKYHNLKGALHYNLEQFSDAIKSLTNIIKLKIDDPNVYHLRGLSNFKIGEIESAKKDFNQAISINKNFAEAYFGLGIIYFEKFENSKAIDYFVQSTKMKNKFDHAIGYLTLALASTDQVLTSDSSIINSHNKIRKIKIEYSKDKFIDDIIVKNFLFQIDNILKENCNDINLKTTQVFRKNHTFLNCKRQKKIFSTYEVIPKFCFGCYKVQIEPQTILDLIKLFIIFDNINLENDNFRKTMIEIRPNVKGNYKGLIYCDSLAEAKIIQNKLKFLLQKNIKNNIICKVKRGCTEFAEKFPNYNSFDETKLSYNENWQKYENIIDDKYPHFKLKKQNIPTVKGVSLNDALVIRNWLNYSKKIGDNSLTFL